MHHTKDKGNIGLSHVIWDLTQRGFDVFLPLGEPVADLIATHGARVVRIQVKYRDSTAGRMEVILNNSWGNSTKGAVRGKIYSREEIDYFAVTDGCNIAYVKYEEIQTEASFAIRTKPTRNGQRKGIRMLEDYQVI